MPGASLLSLVTALPPYELPQAEVLARAEALFEDRYPEFRRLKAVFRTTGIERRWSVRPFDWFAGPLGWPERTEAFLEGAEALFLDAAVRALAAANLDGSAVDAVVTVTSTGIATPSLEARVATRLGLRPDILRVPVFGLGCAGGVSGLSAAARLAEARPGTNVLFVAVELCTLAFRLDELTSANVVATALFGDGAAAVVLRAGESKGLGVIEADASHTWPDTLDVMGWRVDPQGLGVIFAQSIPPFAEANLGPAMAGMLGRMDLRRENVDRFVCHPGGVKVISALESSLELQRGALDAERAVLADCGNMSSPTVLFVLERVLAAPAPPRRSVLTAMGPGFSAACASFRAAA
jgi:alkylresorcinol/alkylpyrone synthase